MDFKILLWYNLSIIVLSFLLYKPVKKIILAGRINRTQKKLNRELTEEELKAIEKRTFPLAVALVIIFSMLFNYMLSGKLYDIK